MKFQELYKLIKQEGYHLVSGWKKKRHDPISKTIPSKFFNYVTRKISGINSARFQLWIKGVSSSVVKKYFGVWRDAPLHSGDSQVGRLHQNH
jgi:hypothetical protein